MDYSNAKDPIVEDNSFSETVDHRYLPFSPITHALLITGIPAVAIVSVIVLAFYGITPTIVDLLAFLVMFTVSIIGMTVGYHRHFTHHAFKAPNWIRKTLIVLGSFCAQGPVIYWVALHRRHHQIADQPGDPHSPYYKRDKELKGFKRFLHSHVGWVFDHDVPNTLKYARDLLKDKGVIKISKYYTLWVFLGIALPGIVCGLICQSYIAGLTGALWGGPIRIIVGENGIWTITSLAHLIGKKDYKTRDESRNIWWLSIFTFGESWHNNHHAFPTSARFGLEWWQVDFGGWIIMGLEKLGLAWDVKHPSMEQRAKARI